MRGKVKVQAGTGGGGGHGDHKGQKVKVYEKYTMQQTCTCRH